ncbi:Holliday junction branch migration DNA helicase RuvB [Mycoplasma todarodis]|uniref:Holliday junction branch migration complex subunit RuvB n=1 Tax=Mycoplasma todarodis TaxID=1937191 RepID=A0A4R0XKN7_9MOLU|nr:Holliday junction branch migration DNA helicase RuvB [Mycoplasma todarodis]TCG11203.1 Holliday junction branch migration DNA helicase RuvB [Mycoplasma todarodis]
MQSKKSLRPQNFEEFIGQRRLVHTLKIMIDSAIKRKVMCDHILLHGKPGIGKTSLALLIAKEMNTGIKFAQGSLMEKKADILSLFATIQKNDVIFIDEFHGINKQVEELIYSALEDGVIDIPIGIDGESKIVRMKLPPFTMIGATTKFNKISLPLRERFGLIGKLIDYEKEELISIINITSKKLKIKGTKEAKELIASYSNFIPRTANNLLKRCRDFSLSEDKKQIDKEMVLKTFRFIGLYKYGLNDMHIEYIKVLGNVFNGGWTSLEAISGVICESKENIEQDIEPILLKRSLLKKSSRGRMLTTKGINYLTTYNL